MTLTTAPPTNRDARHQRDQPVVTLQEVWAAYTPTSATAGGWALEDVSITLQTGERVAVVGPNGAGKSTLLKLIVGQLRPARGAVHIYGSEPMRHICIAYVPQRNQIDWAFPVTVEEVVMMGRIGQIGLLRWPRRRDWERVHTSLARVGAAHLAHQPIGALSGGQQQRVFIARALAQQAELLLMDEPLTGLDAPGREALFEILDNVAGDGVTTVMATHDLNLAAERFDRLLLLNRQVVAFGRPDTVLTPAHLLQAYGGQVRTVSHEEGSLLIADTCCDDGEAPL